MNRLRLISASAALALGACASVPPSGPSVAVMPGTGKSFDQFRADDHECRQYASGQIGGATGEQAQESSAVKSAAIGAAVGTAAGALIGGNHHGAAVGAGTGLIIGSAVGASKAEGSVRTLQQRYDIGYQQCMYAKGHRVPLAGRFEDAPPRHARGGYAPPPQSALPPPPPGSPPPGSPPPPPPGAR